MIALLQRVTDASVSVRGQAIAAIARGLVIFLGVERGDTENESRRLAERVLAYRVFPDASDRMNVNVVAAGGALLIVSQFTLAADTNRGHRASFSSAADPESGQRLYEHFVKACREAGIEVATGRFGADMQVRLTNDGPVTFRLEVPARRMVGR
jgi:D-tyrosyl-tRNA(Tyr) deacylase